MKKLLFTLFGLMQVIFVMAQNPAGSEGEKGNRLRQPAQNLTQTSDIKNANEIRKSRAATSQINPENDIEMHFNIINVPTGTKAAHPIVIHYDK